MGHKAPKPDLRCNACRDDKCGDCMDILMRSMGMEGTCPCTRKHHTDRMTAAIEANLDNQEVEDTDYYEPLEPL